MKKQYYSLDLFKFIFAIVVVMIHTTPLKDISDDASWYFNNTFCNIAVPFFFITSGFLAFERIKDMDKKSADLYIKNYIKHILAMYLIWCILWIPWKALNFYNSGHFTFADAIYYIRDILFISGGDALWYLPALAIAVFLVYILHKTLKVKYILGISAVFYIIGVLISSWYGITKSVIVECYYMIFKTAENGILYGFLFVTIGAAIAQSKNKLTIKNAIVGFITAFICVIAESLVVKYMNLNKDGVCELLTIPIAAYFVFMIIINIKCSYTALYSKLRDYSIIIYLCHCYIIRSLRLLLSVTGITFNSMAFFGITVILSLIFAVIVRYMKKVKNNRLFRLLY